MASPIRFAKVRKQLEVAGYRLVRISGSHHIFDRPGGPLNRFPFIRIRSNRFMRSKSPKSLQPTKRKAKVASQRLRKEDAEKGPSDGVARPFAADVDKRAKSIAAEYQIVVGNEDGEWYGRGLELPHV